MPTDSAKVGEELLYRCPHCQKVVEAGVELVGQTTRCPHCDGPFQVQAPIAQLVDDSKEHSHRHREAHLQMEDERAVVKVHPAMFRNRPLLGFLCLTVTVLGAVAAVAGGLMGTGLVWGGRTWVPAAPLTVIGLVLLAVGGCVLLVWFFQTRFKTLTVTNKRTRMQYGIIQRHISEVQHDDVRNMQVEQSFLQRLLGVGTLALSSSGQDDLEIVAKGIPHPNHIADEIRRRQ